MRWPIVIRLPAWPPRDWRRMLALFFLAGGGMACTALAVLLAHMVAERSAGPWALAYALYMALGLISMVLGAFTWVMGRATWHYKDDEREFSMSGGDEDEDAADEAIRESPPIRS